MMKRWIQTIGISLALVGLLWLTGCRTSRGAGEDLEAAGEKVQEWAE
jgi:predicted small secreted protein